ncbi:MAG: hypothetical protein ACYCQK_10375 [Acidiferrobacteraceae bacterium]
MSLAIKTVYSKRPTYTASYAIVGTEPQPKKPKRCIFAKDGDPFCKIRSKGRRKRKIGIEHPLYLFGCRSHRVFFTVYPLGWYQYGRRALVELAPDGSEVDISLDVDPEDDADADDGPSSDGGWWLETAFGAAIDAKNGRRWPLTSLGILTSPEPKPYGVFRTQRRHLAGVLRLFRIDDLSGDRDRELVAARLPVGTSTLKGSATRVRDGPEEDRWQREGVEGTTITKKLTPPRRWLKHLLELGAAVNFWGSPMYG